MKPNNRNQSYVLMNYETYNATAGEDLHIVLMRNEKTGMYVTWECRNSDDFFWGHYFNSFVEAKLDYHKRLAENYERRLDREETWN